MAKVSSYAPTADGGLYRAPDYLLLFGQINLARCAAERAQTIAGICDGDRFASEYDTAKLWAHKKVMPLM